MPANCPFATLVAVGVENFWTHGPDDALTARRDAEAYRLRDQQRLTSDSNWDRTRHLIVFAVALVALVAAGLILR
jgi:hypothetical protein